VNDYFEKIKADNKKERDDLAKQGLQELIKTDWMRVRFSEKTTEDSIRRAVDEFFYDITAHEKEMSVCPKLEELIINIARKQLMDSIPYDYKDFVAQTDRDEYLHACTSIEDLIIELNSFMSDALDQFDYEEPDDNLKGKGKD
jgi:hypothetical protein